MNRLKAIQIKKGQVRFNEVDEAEGEPDLVLDDEELR
jgi:hypothetical protein